MLILIRLMGVSKTIKILFFSSVFRLGSFVLSRSGQGFDPAEILYRSLLKVLADQPKLLEDLPLLEKFFLALARLCAPAYAEEVVCRLMRTARRRAEFLSRARQVSHELSTT